MSTPRHFGLDLLRACAILGVLVLHADLAGAGMPGAIASLARYGWVGVDLFFVLSGFLLAAQVMDAREPSAVRGIRTFWARRWTRTLPLYAVVLLCYVVLKPAIFGAPFQGDWRFALFLQNTGPITDFNQSWSLCIEEQFYFVFPLVFYLLRPRRAAWYLLPLAISVALRLAAWHALGLPARLDASLDPVLFDRTFRFNTLRHLDGISIGIFLAATRPGWRRWPARARGAAGALALLLLAATPWIFSSSLGGGGAVLAFLWLSCLFGALLIGVDGWSARPLGGRAIERIAVYSYGAYLWNNVLLRLMQRHPVGWPWPVGTLVFVGGAIALGAATYYAVEKPGMRLRKFLVV